MARQARAPPNSRLLHESLYNCLNLICWRQSYLPNTDMQSQNPVYHTTTPLGLMTDYTLPTLKKMPMQKLLALALALGLLAACQKEEDPTTVVLADNPLGLPTTPLNYSDILLPAHFTTNAGGGLPSSIVSHDNMPASNRITDWGATLGRVLFYDVNLSQNRRVSCGSCHNPAQAFSDDDKLSKGFADGLTRRHSMSLLFARYYQRGRFFWDERAQSLEEQVLMPIQDQVEMGLSLEELQLRVEEQAYYPELFAAAFGDETINTDRIAKALAQFVRSIVSYNSRYDQGRAQVNAPGAPFPNFTALENQGKQLFFLPVANGGAGCLGCHTSEAFINAAPGPINNGLDEQSTTDLGAFEANPRAAFLGAFKTPSLRNIALSAPYMHDGRFATLAEVVEHYNSGVKNHPNLGAALRDPNGNPLRLNLSQAQKDALVAFLQTLTDTSVATDQRWSNPF